MYEVKGIVVDSKINKLTQITSGINRFWSTYACRLIRHQVSTLFGCWAGCKVKNMLCVSNYRYSWLCLISLELTQLRLLRDKSVSSEVNMRHVRL